MSVTPTLGVDPLKPPPNCFIVKEVLYLFLGFTCECNAGYIDVNNDGTDCSAIAPCCAKIVIEWANSVHHCNLVPSTLSADFHGYDCELVTAGSGILIDIVIKF